MGWLASHQVDDLVIPLVIVQLPMRTSYGLKFALKLELVKPDGEGPMRVKKLLVRENLLGAEFHDVEVCGQHALPLSIPSLLSRHFGLQ